MLLSPSRTIVFVLNMIGRGNFSDMSLFKTHEEQNQMVLDDNLQQESTSLVNGKVKEDACYEFPIESLPESQTLKISVEEEDYNQEQDEPLPVKINDISISSRHENPTEKQSYDSRGNYRRDKRDLKDYSYEKNQNSRQVIQPSSWKSPKKTPTGAVGETIHPFATRFLPTRS